MLQELRVVITSMKGETRHPSAFKTLLLLVHLLHLAMRLAPFTPC